MHKTYNKDFPGDINLRQEKIYKVDDNIVTRIRTKLNVITKANHDTFFKDKSCVNCLCNNRYIYIYIRDQTIWEYCRRKYTPVIRKHHFEASPG